jgi:cysteine rich repeat protein
MRCLQRNAGQLSPPCKTALAAHACTASPEAMAILRICGEEMRLLCGDIPSGGGRVISCLAEHAQRLSPVCYRALAAAPNY